MKKIIFVLLLPIVCFAKTMKTGLMVSGNYSQAIATSVSVPVMNGWGGIGGGLMFSFFEESRFALRLSGNYVNVNTLSNPASIRSPATIGAASVSVNWDSGPNRHGIGFGYSTTYLPANAFSGTAPVAANYTGFVLEGKDWWKSGWFDLFQGYFLKDTGGLYSSMMVGVFSIGYEF
jgi:hypothetical protein